MENSLQVCQYFIHKAVFKLPSSIRCSILYFWRVHGLWTVPSAGILHCCSYNKSHSGAELSPTENPTTLSTSSIPSGTPTCLTARISGALYKEAPGASSVTSMPSAPGDTDLIGRGHAFTEVEQLGFFSMPRGTYFEMTDAAKRKLEHVFPL